MAQAHVRTATPADVSAIAALHSDTWRAAYADLLPQPVLDGLTGAEAERAWADAVDGGALVLLATEGAAEVGFCVAGPAPSEDSAGADGSLPDDAATIGLISTLLVSPRWARRGHGGRLLAHAAHALAQAGATRGITWVPAEDPASLSFYRRAGWEPDGTVRTLDAGDRALRELRLSGSLDLPLVA